LHASFRAAALIGLVAALGVWLTALGWRPPARGRAALMLTGFVFAAGVVLLLPPWDLNLLAGGVYKYAPYIDAADLETELRAWQLLYYQDGAVATVSVRQLAGMRALVIDGKVDASNMGDMLTQRLLGLLPVLLAPQLSVHAVSLGLGTVVVKAVVLPWFLAWAIREAAVRREIEPLVGFIASLLLGALAVALAFAIAARLPLPATQQPLLVPVSLATLMIGFLVLTTRRKALMQVVGYLILENGIYLFGLTQTESVPFLIEIGVLLDVFVGVFIMGIVVFHINREFDSLDSTRLTELSD